MAESAATPISLELSGTLILDANRMSHVHARFPGEIVELGKTGDDRPVDFGATVQQGQLLAVIWSRDLGEKKSELVDSLSQQWADEATLARLTAVAQNGVISDRTLRDAERKVAADRIATARVVRTLETWRMPKKEIEAVRAEARRLSQRGGQGRDREELAQRWARLEVRAPWPARSSSGTSRWATWSTRASTCSRSPTCRGSESSPTLTRSSCGSWTPCRSRCGGGRSAWTATLRWQR